MSAEPPLCARCSRSVHLLATDPNSEVGRRIIQANNFLELERSCAAGCPFCKLIRQQLVYGERGRTSSIGDLRSASAPVIVHLSDYAIRISSPAHPGYDYIYYLEAETTLLDRNRQDESQNDPDDLTSHSGGDTGTIHSLQSDEGLDAVVAIARGWISNCLDHHVGCSLLGTAHGSDRRVVPMLPTRVIDVGVEPGPPRPRLVVQGGSKRHSEYFTLSYSWGRGIAPQGRLTPRNLEAMQQGIDMSTLPKTIHDAVIFTKRMGVVRYIWVDALCIIQQDDDASDSSLHREDWASECANFGRYYTDALCTLAATGSSSSDEGLFLDRPALEYPAAAYTVQVQTSTGQREPVVIEPAVPNWWDCISRAPLTSRGWAMQERAMSPRILHFTKHAVFWECAELRACEFEAETSSRRIQWPCLPGEEPLNQLRLSQQPARTRLHDSWYDLAGLYSWCQFTFPSDRLPALSGLAKQVQAMCNRTEDDLDPQPHPKYHAGLWEGTVHHAIAWYSAWDADNSIFTRARQQKDTGSYIAPSWSWTCLRDGRLYVRFVQQPPRSVWLTFQDPPNILGQWHFPLEIIDIKVQHAGPDPMGGVSYGKLRVNGLLAHVDMLEWEVATSHRGHVLELSNADWSGEEHRLRIHLDSPMEEDNHPEGYSFPYKDFYCLLVAFGDEDILLGNQDPNLVGIQRIITAALALRPTGNTADGVQEYTRIGLVFVAKEVLFSAQEVKTVVDIV
ncbi:putative heterokaryon incompatibility protein [Cercophora samala]|uniref:Heterokaryon incompatibility protein n=1 Tax=Cercophora samala TaxID=330535 RepID=A0AA39Z8F3_9PEZI|nr:putative heterokaryon incompatibility protein [Cercophora samala]